MKTKTLAQVDLIVDTDGPMADFYRYKKGSKLKFAKRSYRARSIESPAAKAHFLKRVHALQMALCKAA